MLWTVDQDPIIWELLLEHSALPGGLNAGL